MKTYLCDKHGPQQGIWFHQQSLVQFKLQKDWSKLVRLSGSFMNAFWVKFLVEESFIENFTQKQLEQFFANHADHTFGICTLCFEEYTGKEFSSCSFSLIDLT